MAKKYSDLIAKTDHLISGLMPNLDRLKSKNIDLKLIDELSEANTLQKQYNEEYDKLKAEFKSKTFLTNRHYMDVSQQLKQIKKAVKTSFPKEEWVLFGILDKK